MHAARLDAIQKVLVDPYALGRDPSSTHLPHTCSRRSWHQRRSARSARPSLHISRRPCCSRSLYMRYLVVRRASLKQADKHEGPSSTSRRRSRSRVRRIRSSRRRGRTRKLEERPAAWAAGADVGCTRLPALAEHCARRRAASPCAHRLVARLVPAHCVTVGHSTPASAACAQRAAPALSARQPGPPVGRLSSPSSFGDSVVSLFRRRI
jgi:hypothetical protein